jgi:Rps23 Pro-64 3,4-dihydroxylase Tpa1-like proline 4-hydroxylase
MFDHVTKQKYIYANNPNHNFIDVTDRDIESFDAFAKDIQTEILALDDSAWDRYQNPIEEKFTLRDKFNFPQHLASLFAEFESDAFIDQLSAICGYRLIRDSSRNFWGVHTYENGDRLDIHVDAGIHPTMNCKKQLTLGLYLSASWDESYGCKLELWKGDNAANPSAKLDVKVHDIAPICNRLILFTCNDYSWHGNPEPVVCPSSAKRIFVTMSYMSENTEDLNKAGFETAKMNHVKENLRLIFKIYIC